MQIYRIQMRRVDVNTYVLVNEDKEALLIDPGSDYPELIAWLNEEGFKPIGIMLTHTHFDHIIGLDAVRDAFHIEAYSHEIEQDYVTQPDQNLSSLLPGEVLELRPIEHVWSAMGPQEIGPFKFNVAFTPGHSPGHVIYHFPDKEFAIVGDTVFQGSIGRTDLPGGDMDQLLASIREEIFTLPDETVLYPGHGEATNVAMEKQYNPFF